MKRLLTLCTTIFITALLAENAISQINPATSKKSDVVQLSLVPFTDYFPLGETEECKGGKVFDDLIDELSNSNRTALKWYCEESYEDAVRAGTKGKSDIILGMYADTSIYDEWKIIYPAIMDNPVHLVMTPSHISGIKSIDNLKDLKGGIHVHDHFSDYVTEQLQSLNIKKFDNSFELYQQLISGEIDYIFTTYWFGMAEVLKLGVKDMVVFSKKSIWHMPLFIGISKMSSNRAFLSHHLTEWIEKEENRDKIYQKAIKVLEQTAEENRGTVPPTYNIKNSNM